MTIYRKIAGSWTAIDQPKIKVGGVWKNAVAAFVKEGGVWEQVFAGDTSPPDPPEIILDNIENKYISVGVRLTDPDLDTTLRRIRVLATYKTETYPATPFSSGFYSDSDTIGGPEPWSDWFYNVPFTGKNGQLITPTRKSNEVSKKKFMPTYYAGKKLSPGTRYNFKAWAEDIYGNWSLPAVAYLVTPKTFEGNPATIRTAVVLPNAVGTLDLSSGIFTEGEAISAPGKAACFDYGSDIINLVGNNASSVAAYVRLHRGGSDIDPYDTNHRTWGGRISTNLTEFLEPSSLYNRGGAANLNAMSKGQIVTKDIPDAWLNNIATGFRGMNLFQHPSYKSATRAVFVSQAVDPNQGAITVRWKE